MVKPPSRDPAEDPASQGEDGGHANLPKIVRFADLARCGDEIWIEHQGQLYRLRRTRQEKLILTK